MSTRDTIRPFLDRLSDGNVSDELFETGLLTPLEELRSEGLPPDIFKSILKAVLSSKVKKVTWNVKLIFCLIPEDKINDKLITKIVLWILSSYHEKPPSIMNALLQWLAAVIEFGIADKSCIDSYYELFYGMLENVKLERYVCHILYLLTRPEDVYRGRVLHIIHLNEKNGRLKHTMALLSLFKSYKPECFPENIPMKSLLLAFKSLPPKLERSFQLAQERLIQNKKFQDNKMNVELLWSRPFVKEECKLIPDAAFVHLGSELYREKRKKITQCLDKRSLMNSQHCLEMPSRALTLLMNEGGRHLVSTLDASIHTRLSYVLYYTLRKVFVEKKVSIPVQERNHFLKQIVELENYMQQGIPVVSLFLTEYIGTWDGLEHREWIYKLLEWSTFGSFAALEGSILDYLDTLFITGSVEEKCLIFRTLQHLMMNMCLHRGDKSKQCLFLGKNGFAHEVDIILPNLANAVNKMAVKGLQMTDNHPLLLHTCISFYEMMTELEDINSSWSILPRACVYRCLFGFSTSALSRTCYLLSRYRHIYSEIKENGGDRVQYAGSISLLVEYSNDFFNCLYSDQAFSRANKGYIFKNLSTEFQKRFHHGNATYNLAHSTIMNALLFFQQKDTGNPDIDEALCLFKTAFSSICSFLDLLETYFRTNDN